MVFRLHGYTKMIVTKDHIAWHVYQSDKGNGRYKMMCYKLLNVNGVVYQGGYIGASAI